MELCSMMAKGVQKRGKICFGVVGKYALLATDKEAVKADIGRLYIIICLSRRLSSGLPVFLSLTSLPQLLSCQ